jgi:TonB-dependent SusC/RagA subfamily outer membrane receptor
LQSNNIPSILIEAGYINNNKDITYLQTTKAKDIIAKNILSAIEKYANENQVSNSLVMPSDTTAHTVFFNVKYADTGYLKSNDYKTKALIIIDDKEIGNFGMNYIETNKISYNTMVVYKPIEAKKIYGDKGNNGAIRLTQKSVVFIKADTIYFDNKSQTVKITNTNTGQKAEFDDALIYMDGKVITPLQLKAIPTETINFIDIFKGEKLPEIMESQGKKTVINISLKPEDLPGITVTAKKPEPLYVIDGKIQDNNFNLQSIAPESIQQIDVLKDKSATEKYGDKGKNGVIEIKTKNINVAEAILQGNKKTTPLYIINGKESTKDEADKIAPEGIEEVREIKETTALKVYGDKGKNGVVLINLKPAKSSLFFNRVTIHGDFNNQGKNPYFEVDGKAYPEYSLEKYMQKTGIEHFESAEMYDKIEGPKKFGIKANDGAIIVTTKSDNSFQTKDSKPVAELNKVPIKIHTLKGNTPNTYNLLGDGTFVVNPNQLYYLNGKVYSNPESIKKNNVVYLESYDPAAGNKKFGEKGKNGVLLITTKN